MGDGEALPEAIISIISIPSTDDPVSVASEYVTVVEDSDVNGAHNSCNLLVNSDSADGPTSIVSYDVVDQQEDAPLS